MATRSASVPRTRVKVTTRAAVVVTIVLGLAVTAVSPVRLYLQQRDQIRQLQQQTTLLQSENTHLNQQMAQIKDPAYLERLARECLGMVRQGETAFVVVPKGEQPEPPSC